VWTVALCAWDARLAFLLDLRHSQIGVAPSDLADREGHMIVLR